MRRWLLFCIAVLLWGGDESFETTVRPVLSRNCLGCHPSKDHFLKAVSTGTLIPAIKREGKVRMPPNGALTAADLAVIEKWVADGAIWPADKKAAPGAHWAFQPVKPAGGTVDTFINAALEKAGLRMAPRADARALVRRLSLVLTGLPPSEVEIERYSSMPYEQVVDSMLASPHFGERWARHWLDVVRFGENHGYEWNYEIHGAWRYRDYLIRAFNQDIPFDQLVREQIAGDLLEHPRINEKEKFNESIIGTAFYRLGEVGHDDCIEFRSICLDVIDNQIDTLGKAFQGLTISCARCHDHKVDPIPTAEYHALLGVLASSRQVVRNIETEDSYAPWKRKLAELKAQIRRELASIWLREAPLIGERLRALKIDEKNKTPLEDPLYPWLVALRTPERETGVWEKLAAEYRELGKDSADFTEFRGWMAEGPGLAEGSVATGDFALETEGDHTVAAVFPRGLFTNGLSDKLTGALRSPLLPKDKKFVSLLVSGGKLAARRTVIDGGVIGENYDILNQPGLRWIQLPTLAEQKGLPIWIDLVTKTLNPRIPDRPGRLKATKEDVASDRSWFGFVRAVLHDVDRKPAPEVSHITRLFAVSGAADRRYIAVSVRAIEAWANGHADDSDALWIDWLVRTGLLTNSVKTTARLDALVCDYRTVESTMPTPRVASGMADGDKGIDFPTFPYGDWKSPGKVIPRGYLSVVGKNAAFDQGSFDQGSGRRQLAEQIANAQNPLTARVMANRIWHYLFGRGIVATVDNFGRIGEPPTHPELLDHLATSLIQNGWSIKSLIREIALSNTFQQAGVETAEGRETDPRNQLLHHYPVRRLEAEAIRDSILATSGRLDPTLYGESVEPYRDTPKEYRRLYAGPLDGKGRRSVYLKVTRMEWSRFLETFDFPAPQTARGARDVTNVPAQALALMNDPFVIEQAGVWADTALKDGSPNVDDRLQRMVRRALGRPVSVRELEGLRELAAQLADQNGVARKEVMTSRVVWRDVAHSLFNLKEFIYIP